MRFHIATLNPFEVSFDCLASNGWNGFVIVPKADQAQVLKKKTYSSRITKVKKKKFTHIFTCLTRGNIRKLNCLNGTRREYTGCFNKIQHVLRCVLRGKLARSIDLYWYFRQWIPFFFLKRLVDWQKWYFKMRIYKVAGWSPDLGDRMTAYR